MPVTENAHVGETSSLLGRRNQMRQQQPLTLSVARQRITLATILALQFCTISFNTCVYPFYPAIARDHGLTSTETGLVFSAYDAARFFTSPLAGSLLAKWNPKSMCAFGSGFTAVVCLLFGFLKYITSRDAFLVLCIIDRFIAGSGAALITVAATSTLMKTTSYGTNMIVGFIEVTLGTALVAGPTIGSGIFQVAGYEPIFLTIGGAILLFLIIFLVVVVPVEETEVQSKDFKDLLKIPGCVLVFIHCVVVTNTASSRIAGITDWMNEEYSTSSTQVGLLIGIWSVVYIIMCAIMAKVTDKGFVYSSFLIGWILSPIVWLLIGPSELLNFIFHGKRYYWVTVISMAVAYGVQAIIYIPPFQALLDLAVVNGHKKDNLHTYGMISGLLNCGLSLGSTIGPIIGGAITDALDYAWFGTVLAGFNFLLFWMWTIYLLIMKLTKRKWRP